MNPDPVKHAMIHVFIYNIDSVKYNQKIIKYYRLIVVAQQKKELN